MSVRDEIIFAILELSYNNLPTTTQAIRKTIDKSSVQVYRGIKELIERGIVFKNPMTRKRNIKLNDKFNTPEMHEFFRRYITNEYEMRR